MAIDRFTQYVDLQDADRTHVAADLGIDARTDQST